MNETPARPVARPGLVLALLAFGQFMTAIDFDIVFVALPEIGRQLDFSDAPPTGWARGACSRSVRRCSALPR